MAANGGVPAANSPTSCSGRRRLRGRPSARRGAAPLAAPLARCRECLTGRRSQLHVRTPARWAWNGAAHGGAARGPGACPRDGLSSACTHDPWALFAVVRPGSRRTMSTVESFADRPACGTLRLREARQRTTEWRGAARGCLDRAAQGHLARPVGCQTPTPPYLLHRRAHPVRCCRSRSCRRSA